MIFGEYNCLQVNEFQEGDCKIIPIRYEDREEIMRWRNDQINILRQGELLTKEKQDMYFSTVVRSIFSEEKPAQLLFSFFEKEELIGYGGLVHLDWKNKNGEISFILKTELNNEPYYLEKFAIFLELMTSLARSINFHKIFTYGYNTEEYRFKPLIAMSFEKEVVLKNHKKIDSKLYDVLIYSKIVK